LDTQGNSLFNQLIGTSPGEGKTQRRGKRAECTPTAFTLSLKHQKNKSSSGGPQDPGPPSLSGVFIYPARRAKELLLGASIPPKLKRPGKPSNPIGKEGIRLLAGKLYNTIDNVAVIRENLFRETQFSWEHLSVTSFLSFAKNPKRIQ
jgi:hypothetical protein